MTKNKIPVGVKIIAALYYLSMALLALLGILAIVLPSFIPLPLPGIASQGVLVVLGIFMLVLAVASFFIARGLWQGKPWARTIALIFAAIGVINDIIGIIWSGDSLSAIIQAIFSLLFNAVVFSYLAFSKDVKKAFAMKK